MCVARCEPKTEHTTKQGQYPSFLLLITLNGPHQCCAAAVPVRHLNLHEYQSKELMKKHGISVQQFEMANSASAGSRAVQKLGVKEFVVKAQILAGGRGKGEFSSGLKGGVKVTDEYD